MQFFTNRRDSEYTVSDPEEFKTGGRARAGEGGGLPKGLSLFRFVLFSFLMLGAVYACASLYVNSPPRAGDIPPEGVPAASWEPNPLFLPSYLALKLRIGSERTPLGYVFSGRAGLAFYGSASVFFGILIFGGVGWIAGELARKLWLHQRAKRRMAG